MAERIWLLNDRELPEDVFSDSEVLREILLDENGEPRDGAAFRSDWWWTEVADGLVSFKTDVSDWPNGKLGNVVASSSVVVYVIPAEMLEADDE